MHPRTVIKLMWLVPAVLAMLIHFAIAPAKGEQSPAACAQSLGQNLPGAGLLSGNTLEVLSWNIQKASNDGWAQDLASFSEGIHLAFIQEASLQAMIPQAISPALHPVFAPGYSTNSRNSNFDT